MTRNQIIYWILSFWFQLRKECGGGWLARRGREKTEQCSTVRYGTMLDGNISLGHVGNNGVTRDRLRAARSALLWNALHRSVVHYCGRLRARDAVRWGAVRYAKRNKHHACLTTRYTTQRLCYMYCTNGCREKRGARCGARSASLTFMCRVRQAAYERCARTCSMGICTVRI